MLFAACLCSAFLLLSPNCSFNCLPPKHALCSIPKIAALFCFTSLKVFFISCFEVENKIQLVTNRRKGAFFLPSAQRLDFVSEGQGEEPLGWVMDATSFWVTGQKLGLQYQCYWIFGCCLCGVIMKKATLCHHKPCRVQPGQVERVVRSLYPSVGSEIPGELITLCSQGQCWTHEHLEM